MLGLPWSENSAYCSRTHRMQSDSRVRGETKKEIGVCPSSACRRSDIDANGCQRRLKRELCLWFVGWMALIEHFPAHMWLGEEIRWDWKQPTRALLCLVDKGCWGAPSRLQLTCQAGSKSPSEIAELPILLGLGWENQISFSSVWPSIQQRASGGSQSFLLAELLFP